MKRIPSAMLFAAILVLLLASYFYGIATVILSSILIACFFGLFSFATLNALIQRRSNPGLERMDEPSFWFSPLYNAWLYVTDRERWAWHTSLLSYILGAILGTLFGWFLLLTSNIEVSLMSWLPGMFLILSVALLIATSDYWAQTKRKNNVS